MTDMEPQWVAMARRELGVAEIPGRGNEARIVEYHSVTAAGPAPDRVAWCSSAVCWCLAMVGIPHTRSKAAISWEKYGVKCGLIVGAIVVLKFRPFTRKRHVGFLIGVTRNGRVVIAGGNQNDKFSIKSYPRRFVKACRWPSPPIVADPGVGGRTR